MSQKVTKIIGIDFLKCPMERTQSGVALFKLMHPFLIGLLQKRMEGEWLSWTPLQENPPSEEISQVSTLDNAEEKEHNGV